MLVNAAHGEWKLLIMLAYFTGARLEVVGRLQPAHLESAGIM